MADSATPRNTDRAPCVAVAYSGGPDSTALLHATLNAAPGLGLRVAALHVHHGLNPRADEWLARCRERCRRWSRIAPLVFASVRLDAAPVKGESVEAWAREARYRVLGAMAREHGASLVLLAHHRRDQAETFLLQALRKGGVAGLAAMPRVVERAGITWARPWLDRPRESIEAYSKRYRLRAIDDDSNADRRYARNALRHEVWPALERAFPEAEACLAGAAGRAQQANTLLAELAALDLLRATDARGLHLAAWRTLSDARRVNVLRAWLSVQCGQAPTASLIERLLREADRPGAACWPLPGATLHRHRGWLRVAAASDEGAAPRAAALDLSRAGRHRIPGWNGELHVEPVASRGVALERLGEAVARRRSGGETFQLGAGRPARPLKKQYQAEGVAPWRRDGPLLYATDRLIFVPGLGIDARAFAARGVPQAALRWQADRDR